MQRSSQKRSVQLKKKAADFAAKNTFVPFNEMANTFFKQNSVNLNPTWMTKAIEQHHGVSFTELQKKARFEFIIANSSKSNAWLAQQLKISEKTLSRLTKELKFDGKIRASKRYSETKNAVKEKIPLAYHESAHILMRFLFWSPQRSGLSIPQLAKSLNMSQQTVRYAISLMKEQKLIQTIRHEGRLPYFVPSKQGVVWLRDIQSLRKERDAILEKTASISSVIKRKETERQRLTNAVVFIQAHFGELNTQKIYNSVREIDAEINRLKKIQRERKIRKNTN
ncbi:MAG: hypothetical protein WC915_05370 [archaeon]|jgi:DNA-binding transcriptional regulator GbsR (MarR family)